MWYPIRLPVNYSESHSNRVSYRLINTVHSGQERKREGSFYISWDIWCALRKYICRARVFNKRGCAASSHVTEPVLLPDVVRIAYFKRFFYMEVGMG